MKKHKKHIYTGYKMFVDGHFNRNWPNSFNFAVMQPDPIKTPSDRDYTYNIEQLK